MLDALFVPLMIVPLLLIAVTLWSLYDLAIHWDDIKDNVMWLLVILVGGPIGALFYYLMVIKKRA